MIRCEPALFIFILPLLSQHITLDSYIPCLTDLCKALWEVMLSYHRTMQWHEERDRQEPPAAAGRRQRSMRLGRRRGRVSR